MGRRRLFCFHVPDKKLVRVFFWTQGEILTQWSLGRSTSSSGRGGSGGGSGGGSVRCQSIVEDFALFDYAVFCFADAKPFYVVHKTKNISWARCPT